MVPCDLWPAVRAEGLAAVELERGRVGSADAGFRALRRGTDGRPSPGTVRLARAPVGPRRRGVSSSARARRAGRTTTKMGEPEELAVKSGRLEALSFRRIAGQGDQQDLAAEEPAQLGRQLLAVDYGQSEIEDDHLGGMLREDRQGGVASPTERATSPLRFRISTSASAASTWSLTTRIRRDRFGASALRPLARYPRVAGATSRRPLSRARRPRSSPRRWRRASWRHPDR